MNETRDQTAVRATPAQGAILATLLLAAGSCAQDAGSTPDAALTGRAEGRVLGPLGEPMVGVMVWAAVWPAVDTAVARSQTDGSGCFVLSRLPLRSVSVFATAEGHTVGWGNAPLSAEQPIGGEILRLWPASAIRGRVVDRGGAAVADAIVLGTKDFTWFEGRFRSPETRTDAEGRFALTGIPIGQQIVRVWKPGFVMREQPLFAAADSELEVRLERGSGVQLRIRANGVAREQAPMVEVSLYPTRNGSGFAFPYELEHGGRLDADGSWSIAGLPDCEWHVQLQSPHHAFAPRDVRTEPGKPVHELAFEATGQGEVQLHGTLTSAAGEPLAGETLICRTQRSQSMNGGRPGNCTTDAQGHFVLVAPLVPDEPYSLHLAGSRFVLQQTKTKDHTGARDERYLVRYEDKADAQRPLTLVAVPASFVRGRIVDFDGSPVPFRWCTLQVRRDNHWSQMAHATSRRDGTLAFPGVHGLDFDLRIEAEGQAGSAYSEPFRAEPGKQIEAVVAVPRPGRIRGQLLDAAGKPMLGFRLMVQNYHLDSGEQIDGSWTNVMTDRDGRYAFVGVSPSGHKIIVIGGDDRRLFTTDLFGVGVGQTVDLDIRMPAQAAKD